MPLCIDQTFRFIQWFFSFSFKSEILTPLICHPLPTGPSNDWQLDLITMFYRCIQQQAADLCNPRFYLIHKTAEKRPDVISQAKKKRVFFGWSGNFLNDKDGGNDASLLKMLQFLSVKNMYRN